MICSLDSKIITQLFYVAVYIETVNHYMNEGSDIYSCLIDTSKAFDRVHWGKLFSTLIEKNVSFIFLRLIFDSYIRQKNMCCMEYF